jgi:hypothetical protein
LFPRLVRTMTVIMPHVLSQCLPGMPFTVDQQVVEALTP